MLFRSQFGKVLAHDSAYKDTPKLVGKRIPYQLHHNAFHLSPFGKYKIGPTTINGQYAVMPMVKSSQRYPLYLVGLTELETIEHFLKEELRIMEKKNLEEGTLHLININTNKPVMTVSKQETYPLGIKWKLLNTDNRVVHYKGGEWYGDKEHIGIGSNTYYLVTMVTKKDILYNSTIMLRVTLLIVLGAVAAIGQENIKRLIAYSSIGHIGYALAGISTGVIEGYKSTILYIAIYVIMNLAMFACIFLMKKEGKYCEKISDLSGISKKNPILSICLLIILFSLAGIPPLAGFFAKFYVFMAVIKENMYALAIVGLLSTVVSAFYYLRIIKVIYFDELQLPFDNIKNLSISFTLFISCLILVSFFIYPSLLNNIIDVLSIN